MIKIKFNKEKIYNENKIVGYEKNKNYYFNINPKEYIENIKKFILNYEIMIVEKILDNKEKFDFVTRRKIGNSIIMEKIINENYEKLSKFISYLTDLAKKDTQFKIFLNKDGDYNVLKSLYNNYYLLKFAPQYYIYQKGKNLKVNKGDIVEEAILDNMSFIDEKLGIKVKYLIPIKVKRIDKKNYIQKPVEKYIYKYWVDFVSEIKDILFDDGMNVYTKTVIVPSKLYVYKYKTNIRNKGKKIDKEIIKNEGIKVDILNILKKSVSIQNFKREWSKILPGLKIENLKIVVNNAKRKGNRKNNRELIPFMEFLDEYFIDKEDIDKLIKKYR